MFPIRDENPTRSTPVVTIALIAINLVAFLLQMSYGLQQSVFRFGLIPAHLVQGADIVYSGRGLGLGPDDVIRNFDPAWITVFASMFMHGSWLHLLGNMWFLWIFGNNVEDDLGQGKFVLFYVACGLAAAAAQVLAGPGTQVPMVGASGAIGGVLGAYLVLFPGSRVLVLLTLGFFFTTTELPAVIVLGFWFVLQILGGITGFLGPESGGVAYMAHVGGFVSGLVLGKMMGHVRQPTPRYQPPSDFPYWR